MSDKRTAESKLTVAERLRRFVKPYRVFETQGDTEATVRRYRRWEEAGAYTYNLWQLMRHSGIPNYRLGWEGKGDYRVVGLDETGSGIVTQ